MKAVAGPDRVVTDASLLRKDFSLGSGIRSARLTVTALGAYEAWLNGKRIAPQTLLAPGFTDFHKRALYQTYDVTSMLSSGKNALGFVLGGGWHGSPLTWSGNRFFPGPELLRAQLDIAFNDGHHETIGTDDTWQAAAAPVLSSEIYGGEAYDARAEMPGWSDAEFAAAGWSHAATGTAPDGVEITASPDVPITTIITLHPESLDPANGKHPAIFDMGQNMVGNVRLHVHGPRGTVVRLRYAERLNPDGSIYTENLRNATATDYYTLSGKGEESYTPSFTFHGFRYVEVAGYPGAPTKASIDGLVYNSLPEQPSIRFHSSSDLLNRMSELGFWGQRGNFFSIPTDCPQRDERLGWMGDAGVFWRTGTYNFDTASFTQKFMNDIVDAQLANGSFTDVSPDVLKPAEGAPGWADAGILIPYAAWLQYGDGALLERSWPAMERYMDFIQSGNPDYLRSKQLGNNYGDWLAPDPRTPRDLIATAYWAIIAREMEEMSKALHRTTDAEKYEALYQKIADAYRKAYVKADGSVEGDTQSVLRRYAGQRHRAGGDACGHDGAAGEGYRGARQSPDDRLSGHAVPDVRARRKWSPGCGVQAAIAGHVSVVGLHGAEGRDDLVGALEWRHRRSGDELLQPLRVRVGDGLGLPTRCRHRHRCGRRGISSSDDHAALRREPAADACGV